MSNTRARRAGRSSGDFASGASEPARYPGKVTRTSRLQMQVSPRAVQLHGAGHGPSTEDIHAAAERGIKGSGGQLPHLDRIQQSFGNFDVSGVVAHTGSQAQEAASAMGAAAYTTGNHVVLGNKADLHTVAHEAAHAVQQRAGVSLKDGVGQVGDPYEDHADKVADRVVKGESAEDLLKLFG